MDVLHVKKKKEKFVWVEYHQYLCIFMFYRSLPVTSTQRSAEFSKGNLIRFLSSYNTRDLIVSG